MSVIDSIMSAKKRRGVIWIGEGRGGRFSCVGGKGKGGPAAAVRTGDITGQFPETANHVLCLVEQIAAKGVEVLKVFSVQHLWRMEASD